MFLGIDVSTYFEELDRGAVWYDADAPMEPLDAFRRNGVDYMRIRVWNDPHSPEGKPYLGGSCDLANFLRLGRLAADKGYRLLLDLHYSDFWVDPAKQTTPKAWAGLDLAGLEGAVYDFTRASLEAIQAHGLDLALIQVGNEITNGILWPLGRLTGGEGGAPRENYPALARLLKAGVRACREVFPKAGVILHLERSYDQAVYTEFFSKMEELGVDYDVIGASYYPYWHGTFDQFFANMDLCGERFGKPRMVMETGYGFTLEDYIKTTNGGLVFDAATVESLDCRLPYPLTSDNGYFMFYDKSVVKEEHLDSLEDILADCEAANRNFSYELEGSAWYNAGFFFATGCKSDWTTDLDGKFTAVDDTFNSKEGVIALRGMQKVLRSKSYVNSSNHADFGAAIPSAVVISGAWDAKTAQDILGENYGAAELPSFEVDGKTYHIGSFSGGKLMGVKPQADATRAAVLQQLALYLSGEECQKQRFDQFGWGPSNKNLQALPEVQANVALSALAAQNAACSIPQGQIHGSWWDIAKVYATAAREAAQDDTAALQAALTNYRSSIDALFSMSAEELRAFTVIGSINGDGWTIDLPMTETEPGKWVTNEAYTMDAGVEFKCRQGKSWDVAFGKDGNNFVVETAGTYKIQLTVTGEGDSMQGTVELIPG